MLPSYKDPSNLKESRYISPPGGLRHARFQRHPKKTATRATSKNDPPLVRWNILHSFTGNFVKLWNKRTLLRNTRSSRFLRRTEPICLDKDYRSSKYIETSAYFREIWRKPCHERLLFFVSFFPVLIQSDHDVVFAKCYVLLVKREREKRRSRNHFLSALRYGVFLTGNRLSCIHTKSVTWYIARQRDRAQDHWAEPQHATW